MPPTNSLQLELLEALDAVRRRVSDMRWAVEEGGGRDRARLLEQLREAERELDDLRALLREAERPAAPPLPQPRPAERKSSGC